MRIGVPKEVKGSEYRAGLTPSLVHDLVQKGHEVLVETRAGHAIGYSDEDYRAQGAKIVASAASVYEAPLIVKVKEPTPQEWPLLFEGQTLFCYLHLAASLELTQALVERKVTAIAYETVTDDRKKLPLLIPMSEIAGKASVQLGAFYLQMGMGGRGSLMGRTSGVLPSRVVVIGGGTVGEQAAKMALGMGADVFVFDRSLDVLRRLDALYGERLKTEYSEKKALIKALAGADLVVGSVLLPGEKTPKVVTASMIGRMPKRSVFVDVAIDQGGCSETSRFTTHEDPVYLDQEVIHYCVPNIPGAYARTATEALVHATYPYLIKLVESGVEGALNKDEGLLSGLNVSHGHVYCEGVAKSLGLPLKEWGS